MAQLVDYLIIFLMAAIWAVMPSDGIALVTQWFYHKVVQVSVFSILTNSKDKSFHLLQGPLFQIKLLT